MTVKKTKTTYHHTIKSPLLNICLFLLLHTPIDTHFLMKLSFFHFTKYCDHCDYELLVNRLVHLSSSLFTGCLVLGVLNAPQFT